MLSKKIKEKLFHFEHQDHQLKFIPLIVRYRLDLVRIKLHLKQWGQLNRIDKEKLILWEEFDSDTDSNEFIPNENYRSFILKLIESIGDNPTLCSESEMFVFDPFPSKLLPTINKLKLNIDDFWNKLNPFQKYVLVKLLDKSEKKQQEIIHIIKIFNLNSDLTYTPPIPPLFNDDLCRTSLSNAT